MKSVKWFYVGAMAIALGMLTFATVACHDDDDDPKPAEGGKLLKLRNRL